jgi:hypothetical protein
VNSSRYLLTAPYWYLTGVPELMDIVGAKFERFALQGGRDE